MTARRIVSMVAGVALVWGLAGCTTSVPTTQQSQERMAVLPAPARLAAEREAHGGVRAVTTEEFDGKTVYRVKYIDEQRRSGEIQLTGDGRLLSRHLTYETVAFSQVPQAVREALLTRTGGVAPRTATHEERGDASSSTETYKCVVYLAGVMHEYVIDTTGGLYKQEVGLNVENLPVPVLASVKQRFNNPVLSRAEEIQRGTSVIYEVTGKADGGKGPEFEVQTSPDGTIHSVRAL